MHQITDAEMQAEMKRLLTGIQVKWLRPRLRLNGKPPSRTTIYDWIDGKGVTLEHLLQVAAAVERPVRLSWPDNEAPPPAWATGLQRGMSALLEHASISPDAERDLALARAVAEDVLAQRLPARGRRWRSAHTCCRPT